MRDLSKSFGATSVLKDVSLDVRESEIVSLLGPSGCGKSTLLRVVAGLEQAEAGTIELDGRDVTAIPPGQRGVAMVFQSLALYPHLTARQNIALPLRVRRLTKLQRLFSATGVSRHIRNIEKEIDARVEELAAKLAVSNQLDRVPSRLSGGQRQRVAIGRALVRESRLLLLDEPLSSLDAKLRVQAREEILQIQRNFGFACIFVTHDQAEALAISDRVAVMLNGRIAQFAPPSAIYRHPADIEVARFVGSPTINCIAGVADQEGNVRAGSRLFHAGLDVPANAKLTVAIRPEHVQIKAAGHGGGAIYRVHRTEDHGHDGLVFLEGLQEDAPLVARVNLPICASTGERVCVTFPERDVHFFAQSGSRLDRRTAQVSRYALA
ncbi:MAG: ABC transporter ATP-binding protein [Gemmatimonas sp.]